MIRNPCSGGVVAIAPPVRDRRIVAVAAPGTGGRVWPYWGRGGVPPRRRVDGLRGHGTLLRVAGAGQPRPDGGRGAGPPGPRGSHRGLGRALPQAARAGTPAGRPAALRGGMAASPRRGGPLRRMAHLVRTGGRRPPAGRRGGRVGASPPAGRGRGRHARAHPHRARRARPGGRRHAAASARTGKRPGLLGLDIPGAARAAAADRQGGRARRAGRPALPGRGRAASSCSSATWWCRSGTSPTNSSRRSPRSAGAAARSNCSTRWPGAVRWPTCATRTTAARSVSCTR